ncbi:MAG: hypothetical protein GY749_09295 [Desulfobacteraceae bacterium]|nr:hypothetical protein [Desulfobacteraceae bacterium]
MSSSSSSLLFQRGKELKERLSFVRETIKKNQDNKSADTNEETPAKWMHFPGDSVRHESQIKEIKLVKQQPDGENKDENPFENRELRGHKTLTYPDGKKYEGQYKNGMRHGHGVLTFPSGTKYVGQFKDDKRHGQGTLTYTNGFKYVGQFKDNKSNGQGILTFPDGTEFTGQFRDGKFNGHGTLIFHSGAKYTGQFKDDKRHGQGEMGYPNGFRYVGQFVNNKASGQGTLTFPDGTRYVGQFRNDKRHGHGAITYPNGLKYAGQFMDEKYHGHGTLTFPDGTKYEGQFRDDKYHGHGIITFSDGTSSAGQFFEGKLQDQESSDLKDHASTTIFADNIGKTGKIILIEKHDKHWNLSELEEHRGRKVRYEEDDPRSVLREQFEARHHTADGHYVRSKAEKLVDNWLYMMGIVHVYEKSLPVREEVYSNFYLPKGNIYIECWGYEKDSEYLYRKNDKIEIYNKHNLNLIGLFDDDIYNLDSILPKKLSQFGIQAF